MQRILALILGATFLTPTLANSQELDTRPRILTGYTGAFSNDESDGWRDYLPLLSEHGFTAIDLKLHPANFDLEDDEAMRQFVYRVANGVSEAGLDFYVYLYDRGAQRDPVADAHLPAFVGTDGVENPAMYCLYSPEVWLSLFERVFWMAERSTEVPIAGVKIDIEHLQHYNPCVCDHCFGSFMRACGVEGELPAPAERWAWVEQHGGRDVYLAHLETLVDEAARQYEQRAHAINPDLRLGLMPVRDSQLHRPWLRHLATERAPAIIDSWVMYGGLGWTDAAEEMRALVKSLNPNNLFIPWFRPNSYRPEDMGEHALVAAVNADGYNLWQLNMLHPEQIAARNQSYALPTDYQDPMAYWEALGEANALVAQWLAEPWDLVWEPIDLLVERADTGGVRIADLRPVALDAEPLDEAPRPTMLRGPNTIYVYVSDPAAPIEATIRHAAGDSRPKPIAWALAKGPDQPIEEGRIGPGETAELSLTVPEAGLYALVIAAQPGGGPWYTAQVHSHPHGLDATGQAYFFRLGPPQFLWVPEGAESFSLFAETGGRNQEMRVRVWRPDGEGALDHVVNSDVAYRETLEIAVPEGMDGAIWSVWVGAPQEMPATHYSENYWLRVIGASPYLADRPEAVLAE